MIEKINLPQKFTLFSDHWSPKIIGELNGQLLKIAKIKDEFIWHSHEKEDELFLVIKGTLYMDFRDGTQVIGTWRNRDRTKRSRTPPPYEWRRSTYPND